MSSSASHHAREAGGASRVNWKSYVNLIAMVLTSTIVMYFFMYLNIYRWSDFWLSETRAFMATLMGGTMLAIMLSFMLHMYKTRWLNLTLYAVSILLFTVGLYLVRAQVTVQDQSWMKSMIPHHSIAIMVSERAEITDPRARKLADEIIAAQEKEIAEMEYLIRTIGETGGVGDDFPIGHAAGSPRIMSFAEALRTPAIATVDPGGMTDQEVRVAVPAPVCAFRFSAGQQTMLGVAADGSAVMKVTGQLVRLQGPADAAAGGTFAADGVALTVTRTGEDNAAELIMEIAAEPAMRVGYDGVYICS